MKYPRNTGGPPVSRAVLSLLASYPHRPFRSAPKKPRSSGAQASGARRHSLLAQRGAESSWAQ